MSITHLFPQVDGTPRLANYDDISTYWPQIRKALKEIRTEQGPRATWSPENVLAAVRNLQAELWLVEGKNTLNAFVVTQTIVDPCLHVPHGLGIWMLWRASHTPKHLLVDMLDGFFSQLAATRGLLYVEGVTAWRGLAESLATRGWETVGFITRRQIEEP